MGVSVQILTEFPFPHQALPQAFTNRISKSALPALTLPLALAQSRGNLRCSPPPREECHENLVFQGLEADRLEAFRSIWQGRGSQSARSLLSRINSHSNFPHVSCLVGIHYTAGWNSLWICIAYCRHPAFDRCACYPFRG